MPRTANTEEEWQRLLKSKYRVVRTKKDWTQLVSDPARR
jgi:hypothetical protein